MSVSFQGPEAAPSYSPEAPDVPAASECRSALEIFRLMDHPVGKFLGKTAAFDVRHIGQSLYTKADPQKLPTQRLWMKPRAEIPSETTQHVHRALLTYVVDQVMLEPALRVLGMSWMTPGLVAASLDHAMWFHHDVDINDWLLFDQRCTQVVNGRVLVECSIFTEAPDVPAASECRSALEIFRLMDHPVGKFLGKTAAFDVRHIGQSLYTKADPQKLPTQRLWMKPRAEIPSETTQHIHRALLTYVVDQVMLEPALRVLGMSWMTPGLVAASLDHAMWFHHDVDINDWLLFDQRCTQVVNGRVLVECSIFTEAGVLVAHATQEAMLRVPTEGHTSSHWGFGVDPKTGKPMSGMA